MLGGGPQHFPPLGNRRLRKLKPNTMLRRDTEWEMRPSLSKRLHFIGACRQAKAETFCRAVDRRRYRGLRPFQTLIGDVLADNSAALQKNIFSINSSLDIMLQLHLREIRYLNSDHG